MDMIGLPFPIYDMEEIKNQGANIDMSSINFPGIPVEDQKYTSFIFLRNTGFDVALDFTKCTYEDKRDFLVLYMRTDIEHQYNELAESWIKILARSLNYNLEDRKSILNDEETEIFIEKEEDLIREIYQLVLSLPVYNLFKSTLNGEVYNLNDIEKTDNDIIGINFYHLLSFEEIHFVFEAEKFGIKPLFYEKIFTHQNKELLDAIDNLMFAPLIYGMSSISEEEFKEALDSFQSLLKESMNNG